MQKTFICGFMLLLTSSQATKRTLKQTSGSTNEESKNWERIPATKCGNRWLRETDDAGTKYPTCWGVADKASSCSLTTEDWPLPAGVNTVYVNVTGEGNNCTTCPHYTDYYTLQAYLGSKSTAGSYKTIQKIPTSTFKMAGSFYRYSEIIPITVTGYTHLRLKFKTTYFCGDIDRLNLYYYDCPSTSKQLVTFHPKPAPSGSDTLTIDGFCTANSKPNRTAGLNMPSMTCYSNGTATFHGKCDCIEGYQPKDHDCRVCVGSEYKETPGNNDCTKCGSDSSSGKYTGRKCMCTSLYFRKSGQEKNYSEDCYRPPDPPSDIRVTNLTHNYAKVSWTAPDQGSKPLGMYYISCKNCPKDEKIFPMNTTKTSIIIAGLKSAAMYELSIYNRNNVTILISEANWNVVYFNFTTDPGGKPGQIRDLKHIVNSDYSITLTWKPPFNKGGTALQYLVKYGQQSATTTDTTFVIQTGTEDKTYTVKIYAQAIVKGVVMSSKPFTYTENITVKGGIPLTLTIAVAASVIVLVILVLLGSFCIWKKRHPPYLQVVRMENGAVQLPSKFFSHGKLYVDPTTYNAVDEAVQEFAKEIERKDLTVGELLGGGEFAEVFKGTLYRNGMYKDVAIKTLKSGGVTKRDRDDFFGEAAILGQFSDCPNVVKLEGVILKERPNLIILEFMKNGALDSYLQKNDNQFDVTQLLGMARCVANGMTYLSEIGFIHRDLAARNILVDEFNVCKVSDFGMSREIKLDDTYDTQGGKIPVRWTAPEAIQYKKFTSASDIWSYGILLWEILSFGERPYWDWGNYTVLERLNAEYRLPPPMNCPKVIHDLMLKCWHKDRTKRPKFKEIGDQIEQWIRTPLLLREVASVVRKRDENLDYTVLETINKWLEAIGMDRYTETFLNNGYSTPRQVLSLTMEDLEKLEIGPIGHKKKIFKAIQNTKDQVDARHNSTNSANGKTAKKYNLPIRKK